MIKSRKASGFSLIELSVVLVIIGVLVAAALVTYNVYMQRQMVITTKDNLTDAVEAVAAFQRKNGYFPCPASGTDPLAVATDCSAAAPSGVVRTPTGVNGQHIRIGVLPISALDKEGETVQIAPADKIVDGYRNRLTYAVIETMAIDQASYTAAGEGSIRVNNSEDGSAINTKAKYIILSHGSDGRGAYTATGSPRNTCNSNAPDGENCNGDAVFADNGLGARSFTGDDNNYDDFVGGEAKDAASLGGGGIDGTVEIYPAKMNGPFGESLGPGFVRAWGNLTHKCNAQYCKLVYLNGKPREISSQGYYDPLLGSGQTMGGYGGYVTVSTLWACTESGSGEHGVLLSSSFSLLLDFDGTCMGTFTNEAMCNSHKETYKSL